MIKMEAESEDGGDEQHDIELSDLMLCTIAIESKDLSQRSGRCDNYMYIYIIIYTNMYTYIYTYR